MTALARQILFAVFGSAFLALFISGLNGLQPFGHYPGPYGDILNAVATAERHALNVVTAINFDYRGLDTLGEEFILFASVTGVLLLMRHESGKEREANDTPSPVHGPHEERIDPEPTEFTRLAGLLLTAIVAAFGIYIISTGHLSVGGGFQGGVITSGAWLVVFLTMGSKSFHHFSHPYLLEWLESAGAGGYALIGCASLIPGKHFLANILSLGQPGQLLSTGTILLINCAVGMEVAAGFILLMKEFFRPLEKGMPARTP